MLSIEAISAFSDNYIWLIYDSEASNNKAYVVDPGDAAPVLKHLKEKNLELEGVLITHWHPDHIGGLEDLQKNADFKLKIFGPQSEHIPRINHIVSDASRITILEHDFEVWEVPGHTLDHIAYVSTDQRTVFCGDTLFAAGCGRMFEGTAPQMHASLQRFKELDDGCQIYCAHEYTLSNLKFAVAAEPDNKAVVERLDQVIELRENNKMTVPSNIAIEKQTNPFLRAKSSEQFAELRSWKDNF